MFTFGENRDKPQGPASIDEMQAMQDAFGGSTDQMSHVRILMTHEQQEPATTKSFTKEDLVIGVTNSLHPEKNDDSLSELKRIGQLVLSASPDDVIEDVFQDAAGSN